MAGIVGAQSLYCAATMWAAQCASLIAPYGLQLA
jgi:hypothetical protein